MPASVITKKKTPHRAVAPHREKNAAQPKPRRDKRATRKATMTQSTELPKGSAPTPELAIARIAYGKITLHEYGQLKLTPPVSETPVFDAFVREHLGG